MNSLIDIKNACCKVISFLARQLIRPFLCIRQFFNKWWVHNHQQSHNFFLGISAFLTVISLVVGGYWTIYTFDILNQADKAKIELSELQSKIKNMESSSISLNVKEIEYPSKGLIIEVDIVNNGQKSLRFNLSNDPLKVYDVDVTGDDIGAKKVYKPQYYSSLALMNSTDSNGMESENEYRTDVTLLIGSKKTLSYVVTVEKKGLYYITFEAGHDGSVKSGKNANWFASKYYEVK